MRNLEGRTILIAEDEEMNREMAKDILEMAGATVLTAKDGEEAVSKFLSKDVQLDLILLDITMPKMDGYATCKTMRESTISNGIKIYAMTADMHCYEEGIWREVGMDGVLEKPLSHKELTRIWET